MNIEPGILSAIAAILTFVMLLIAWVISAATTTKHMISLYQVQATVLFLIALLTGLVTSNNVFIFVALIPGLLVFLVKGLLGFTTTSGKGEEGFFVFNIGWLLHPLKFRTRLLMAAKQAKPDWLRHGQLRRGQVLSILIDSGLSLFAFIVANRLTGENSDIPIDTNSLAVSIALLLLGLFIMANNQDTISQIIGLLVMEHGLFLAAIKIIAVPALTRDFIIGLFLYLLITFTLLVWLLPELRRVSNSIELDDQTQLKG